MMAKVGGAKKQVTKKRRPFEIFSMEDPRPRQQVLNGCLKMVCKRLPKVPKLAKVLKGWLEMVPKVPKVAKVPKIIAKAKVLEVKDE